MFGKKLALPETTFSRRSQGYWPYDGIVSSDKVSFGIVFICTSARVDPDQVDLCSRNWGHINCFDKLQDAIEVAAMVELKKIAITMTMDMFTTQAEAVFEKVRQMVVDKFLATGLVVHSLQMNLNLGKQVTNAYQNSYVLSKEIEALELRKKKAVLLAELTQMEADATKVIGAAINVVEAGSPIVKVMQDAVTKWSGKSPLTLTVN